MFHKVLCCTSSVGRAQAFKLVAVGSRPTYSKIRCKKYDFFTCTNDYCTVHINF